MEFKSAITSIKILFTHENTPDWKKLDKILQSYFQTKIAKIDKLFATVKGFSVTINFEVPISKEDFFGRQSRLFSDFALECGIFVDFYSVNFVNYETDELTHIN